MKKPTGQTADRTAGEKCSHHLRDFHLQGSAGDFNHKAAYCYVTLYRILLFTFVKMNAILLVQVDLSSYL